MRSTPFSLAASSSTHWLPVLALAALQLTASAWVIGTATSPARDGGRYFRQALRLEREPDLQVLRTSVDHPGYPYLIHGVLRLAAICGIERPAARVVLCQCVSATCGLIIVLLAFRLFRGVWGLAPAWLGMAAFTLLPGPASYAGDILSDMPHACLWLTGAALLLRGFRGDGTRWFFAAGVAAGAAYWFRVEALSLPLAALASLGALGLRRDGGPSFAELRGSRVLLPAVAFLVPCGALLTLFVLVVGQWSPKPSAEDVLLGGAEVLCAPSSGLADASLAWVGSRLPAAAWQAIVELADETRTLHLVSFALAVGWALRRRSWRPATTFFGLALLAVWMATSLLEARSGYSSGRYYLPLLPFVVCGGMRFWTARGRHGGIPAIALGVLVLSVAVCVPSLARGGLHPASHGQLAAGRWLADRLRGEGTVHDPHFFPTYLVGLEARTVPYITPPAGGPVHFVIADDRLLERNAELRELVTSGRAERVAIFPRRAGDEKATVAVYRFAARR